MIFLYKLSELYCLVVNNFIEYKIFKNRLRFYNIKMTLLNKEY